LIVVALGGNALLQRGQPLEAATQLANVRIAAEQLAVLAHTHRLVVAHGNGPQVGLLALQNAAYAGTKPYPLDVLGAETEGMIGYLIEQELANRLPVGRCVATLLTRVEVARGDIAFERPSKPIGPVYSAAERDALQRETAWSWVADGEGFRRAVPSPRPRRIVALRAVRALLDHGSVVVCAGGGGIPVARTRGGNALEGVEAVIDKDLAAGLLARQLEADMLLIVTDVDAVYADWGRPAQRAIRRASPQALQAMGFADGSMGPKVAAACEFAQATGKPAVIGALKDLGQMVAGTKGTWISGECEGIG
jgi:carbamate kinase